MKASQKAIDLIKEFEGFEPRPYDDAVGIKTIGYGHVIRPGESFTGLTESEATSLLCKDLEKAENAILGYVERPLSQGQFDALCSFVFNLGSGNFSKSTLLRKINAGDFAGAADEFKRWDKAGGKVLAGLTRRRLAEAEIFKGE